MGLRDFIISFWPRKSNATLILDSNTVSNQHFFIDNIHGYYILIHFCFLSDMLYRKFKDVFPWKRYWVPVSSHNLRVRNRKNKFVFLNKTYLEDAQKNRPKTYAKIMGKTIFTI